METAVDPKDAHRRTQNAQALERTDLVALLVKRGGHLQQGAPLVQGCGEGLPLLLQLAGDLLDLLRRVMPRLQQPTPHRHDAVDVHVDVLRVGGTNGARERAGRLEERPQNPFTFTASLDFRPENSIADKFNISTVTNGLMYVEGTKAQMT